MHRALTIRVAESRRDRAEVASIIRERHYLRRKATPPKGAAAMVQVAMLPTNFGALLDVLGLHQAEVLTLTRCWRADDLGPETAPDLMPETLRRVVRRVAADWSALKCANLQARPRLLTSFADPAMGHDGNL